MEIVSTMIGPVIIVGVVVGLGFIIWNDVGRHVVRPRNQRDADLASIAVIGYIAHTSSDGDSGHSGHSGYGGGDSSGGDSGGGGF